MIDRVLSGRPLAGPSRGPAVRAEPGQFSLEETPDPTPAPAPDPRATETGVTRPSPLLSSVGRVVADLEGQRKDMDGLIAQAARGRSFSPGEILMLQSRVYAYGQQMEVVSRVVDKTISAIKTTLNTQL